MTSDNNDTDDENEENSERDTAYRGAASAPTDVSGGDDWDQEMEADHEALIDRRRVDEMTSALEVVNNAAELDDIRLREEVCDDQREQLEEAIDATLEAADAVWPADSGVPHLRDDE